MADVDVTEQVRPHPRVVFTGGNGWSHAWLSMHLEPGDVIAALAEVGLTPDVSTGS